MASKPGGRLSKPAGRASEPAGRASEPAGRPSEGGRGDGNEEKNGENSPVWWFYRSSSPTGPLPKKESGRINWLSKPLVFF